MSLLILQSPTQGQITVNELDHNFLDSAIGPGGDWTVVGRIAAPAPEVEQASDLVTAITDLESHGLHADANDLRVQLNALPPEAVAVATGAAPIAMPKVLPVPPQGVIATGEPRYVQTGTIDQLPPAGTVMDWVSQNKLATLGILYLAKKVLL